MGAGKQTTGCCSVNGGRGKWTSATVLALASGPGVCPVLVDRGKKLRVSLLWGVGGGAAYRVRSDKAPNER